MSWVDVGSLRHALPVGYYIVTDRREVWVQCRDEFGWAASDYLQSAEYQEACAALEVMIQAVWEGARLALPDPPA